MKKINYLFVLLAIFSIVVFGCTSQTQTGKNTGDVKKADSTIVKADGTMMEKEAGEMTEEGFEMMSGKMLMINEKTKAQAAMEKDALLTDGTKVMTDGKVLRKNGTTFMMKEGESIWMDGSFMKAGEMMEKEENMMKKDESMLTSFTGKVLAGTASKYLEFKKADYDKALKEKKKILLYFYANWCPICKKEQVDTLASFNELNDPDLIGFRVNYKDSDTDVDEEALAKEFGVAYQHTKVILKDGQRLGKYPDSWNKQRYLEELARI